MEGHPVVKLLSTILPLLFDRFILLSSEHSHRLHSLLSLPIFHMPSPTKRALLIASPFDGLQGLEHDVETMIKALQSNGFNDIITCVAAEATRDKILEKWKGLIDDTMTGDAVVFYYSGHGALVKQHNPKRDLRVQSKSLQSIVPIDYYKSNSEDFRGISDMLWKLPKDFIK